MYNMARRLVLRGVDGIVFVADSQWDKMSENVESFGNLVDNLKLQGDSIDDIPYVIQHNKRDMPNVAPVNYMEFLLNNRAKRVPSIEAVTPEGVGVFETLNVIAQMVLAKFVSAHSGAATAAAKDPNVRIM